MWIPERDASEINFEEVLIALKDNQDKLTDYQKIRFLMALDRYKRSRDEIFDVFCMMVKTWSEEEQKKYECCGCERRDFENCNSTRRGKRVAQDKRNFVYGT